MKKIFKRIISITVLSLSLVSILNLQIVKADTLESKLLSEVDGPAVEEHILPYDIGPGKWRNNINIYIPNPTNIKDIEIKSSIQVAITKWNEKLRQIGSPIRIYEVNSAAQSNVTVNYIQYGIPVASGERYPASGPTYTSGKITVWISKFWGVDPDRRVPVMIHELGHVLGLDHTTGGQKSIMDAAIEYMSNPALSITAYDVNELNRLY